MGLKSYDFEILDFLVRNNQVSIKELKKKYEFINFKHKSFNIKNK